MTAQSSGTDPSSAETVTQARRTRRAIVVVGAIIPVAIAGFAAFLMISWLPELPDPIAVHWSGAGPDRYGPALPQMFLPLGLAVFFSAIMVGAAWRLQPSGRPTGIQKFMVVTSVWLSAFLSVGIGGSVAVQRGLSDATETGAIGWEMGLGAGISLVLASGAWFLLPAADTSITMGVTPRAVPLSGSERVSWSQVVTISPWMLLIVGVLTVVSGGVAIYTLMVTSPGAPIAVGSLVLVILALASTSYWRVTADRRGLTVRSLVGWPRVRVRAEEIAAVHVVEVSPMADFGGWGYRWAGNGRSGVVMRSGSAIEVTRRSGKRFVVTVDDAQTGAAVLAAVMPATSAKLGR